MKELILTTMLEKEFNIIKDFVVVNIIPEENKKHPFEASNVSDDNFTLAYMIACTKGFIEANELRK